MLIVEFRTAVATAIKAKLPDLKACGTWGGRFDLAALKAVSTDAPAVFVAILGAKKSTPVGDGTHTLPLKLSAFVVTKGAKDLPHDDAALNICEALAGWIPSQRFGVAGVGDASEAIWANLHSTGTQARGVSLMAVTWEQQLTIGAADIDPITGEPLDSADPVPSEVYVGIAPEIGLGHEPDYEEVTSE